MKAPETQLLVVFLGAFALCFAFGFAYLFWILPIKNRRENERTVARYRTLSAAELHAEAKRLAEPAGLRAKFPDAPLFTREPAQSRAELIELFEELWTRADAADAAEGRLGTERYTFFFYDFGLVLLREALMKPLGLPGEVRAP